MALNRVSQVDDGVRIRHVLISVSDKSHLEILVNGLLAVNPDVKLYSTGGTFTSIEKILGPRAKGSLIAVSDYTGQPEMQGGLVKTLDFKIYLGLLSETYNEHHAADKERMGAVYFDMVVVNLYPFQKTVAEPNVTLEDARANIDIGGPCMLRASAKNFLRVASVCDPSDYASLLESIQKNKGFLSLEKRLALAQKAFAHTAAYDAAIADFLSKDTRNSLRAIYRHMDGGL